MVTTELGEGRRSQTCMHRDVLRWTDVSLRRLAGWALRG